MAGADFDTRKHPRGAQGRFTQANRAMPDSPDFSRPSPDARAPRSLLAELAQQNTPQHHEKRHPQAEEQLPRADRPVQQIQQQRGHDPGCAEPPGSVPGRRREGLTQPEVDSGLWVWSAPMKEWRHKDEPADWSGYDRQAAAALRDAAAQLLRRDGWCQHKMRSPDGSRSLLAALQDAANATSYTQSIQRHYTYLGACHQLRQQLGCDAIIVGAGSLAAWNDAAGRTTQKVIETLKQPAAGSC